VWPGRAKPPGIALPLARRDQPARRCAGPVLEDGLLSGKVPAVPPASRLRLPRSTSRGKPWRTARGQCSRRLSVLSREDSGDSTAGCPRAIGPGWARAGRQGPCVGAVHPGHLSGQHATAVGHNGCAEAMRQGAGRCGRVPRPPQERAVTWRNERRIRPEEPVLSIAIGSLPARYIMTTAGNTVTRKGRLSLKVTPLFQLPGADLAPDRCDARHGPRFGGSTGLTCGAAGCGKS
jgi:hypothetical protein